MKKTIFIAVLGLAAVATSYGQGQVHFSNYFTSSSPKVTYGDGPNAGLAVGSEMKAQLAYFQGSTNSPSALTPLLFNNGTGFSPKAFGIGVGVKPPGDPFAGWFDGGAVTVPGTPGADYTFQILAFNGTSYTDPSTTYKGSSALFGGKTQAGPSDGIPDFPQGPWQVFSTSSVPEPGTLALLGLGVGGLLFFRRRQ